MTRWEPSGKTKDISSQNMEIMVKSCGLGSSGRERMRAGRENMLREMGANLSDMFWLVLSLLKHQEEFFSGAWGGQVSQLFVLIVLIFYCFRFALVCLCACALLYLFERIAFVLGFRLGNSGYLYIYIYMRVRAYVWASANVHMCMYIDIACSTFIL